MNHVVQNRNHTASNLDVEIGLHENHHRTYDPKLGRYTQRDPLGLAAGKNPFNYANQSPLDGVDINGLLRWSESQRQATYDDYAFIKQGQDPMIYTLYKIPTNDGRFLINVSVIQKDKFGRRQPNPPGTDYYTDCHGLTFGGGRAVWIGNEDVDNLLAGDGYHRVDPTAVRIGDAVVYRTIKGRAVVHSATVDGHNGTGLTVYQKGGIVPFIGTLPIGPGPGSAWDDTKHGRGATFTEFWRK